MKLSTILENDTGSPIEVTTESATGVYTLMARIKPGEKYELRKGSDDTYLQHWVVIGNSPVMSFNSDEVVDNERIQIVADGVSYVRKVTPRHGVPKPTTTARNQRSQSVGSGSDASLGKPPTGLRKLLSAGLSAVSPLFKRSPHATVRSNSEPINLPEPDSPVRTVQSEPIPDSALSKE